MCIDKKEQLVHCICTGTTILKLQINNKELSQTRMVIAYVTIIVSVIVIITIISTGVNYIYNKSCKINPDWNTSIMFLHPNV